MAITQKLTVIAFKRFNDKVEGRHFDNTKVRLMMPISTRNENAFGFDAVDCNIGTHEAFDKFVNLKGRLPLSADVEFEVTDKGIDVLNVSFPSPSVAPKA